MSVDFGTSINISVRNMFYLHSNERNSIIDSDINDCDEYSTVNYNVIGNFTQFGFTLLTTFESERRRRSLV